MHDRWHVADPPPTTHMHKHRDPYAEYPASLLPPLSSGMSGKSPQSSHDFGQRSIMLEASEPDASQVPYHVRYMTQVSRARIAVQHPCRSSARMGSSTCRLRTAACSCAQVISAFHAFALSSSAQASLLTPPPAPLQCEPRCLGPTKHESHVRAFGVCEAGCRGRT